MDHPRRDAQHVNGYVNPEGTRGAVTCYWDITDVTIEGCYVKLVGALKLVDNPAVFVTGDPVSVEGDVDAGEFTWTIRAAGQIE